MSGMIDSCGIPLPAWVKYTSNKLFLNDVSFIYGQSDLYDNVKCITLSSEIDLRKKEKEFSYYYHLNSKVENIYNNPTHNQFMVGATSEVKLTFNRMDSWSSSFNYRGFMRYLQGRGVEIYDKTSYTYSDIHRISFKVSLKDDKNLGCLQFMPNVCSKAYDNFRITNVFITRNPLHYKCIPLVTVMPTRGNYIVPLNDDQNLHVFIPSHYTLDPGQLTSLKLLSEKSESLAVSDFKSLFFEKNKDTDCQESLIFSYGNNYFNVTIPYVGQVRGRFFAYIINPCKDFTLHTNGVDGFAIMNMGQKTAEVKKSLMASYEIDEYVQGNLVFIEFKTQMPETIEVAKTSNNNWLLK